MDLKTLFPNTPRILIISNGHGEDQIACRLIAEMKGCHIDTLPLTGTGHAYSMVGYTPLMRHKPMPSGGFLRSVSDVVKDIAAGLFSQLSATRKCIKRHATNASLVIAVGDVFCLWMAAHGHKTPIYFLPTAKSDTFMPHTFLERHLIKRLAKRIYTRDALTAEGLANHGLPAKYLGNPMMDGLWQTQKPPVFIEKKPVVALLPGSREEAYPNLVYILQLAHRLQEDHDCHLVWAKSPELSLSKFITYYPKNMWTFGPHGEWIRDSHGMVVHVVSHFPDVLAVADVVIGLAGTANEQAMYLGKPVFAFEGFGPQSTLRRFHEQKALMGGALNLVEVRDMDLICEQIAKVLYTQNTLPKQPTQSAASALWMDMLSTV